MNTRISSHYISYSREIDDAALLVLFLAGFFFDMVNR